MEELKGLIGASQMITTKMGLAVKEFGDGLMTREEMTRDIDRYARELTCLSDTIKHVAYEFKTKKAEGLAVIS